MPALAASQSPAPAQTPTPALTPAPTVERAQTETLPVYEDPAGLFSVPIPDRWTAWTFDGYSLLLDPGNLVAVYMTAARGDDVRHAIDEAWSMIDPGFDLVPYVVAPQTPAEGVEESLVLTYDTGRESRFEQAYSQLHDDVVYTVLFSAEFGAFRRRVLDIHTIATGFTINALRDAGLEETQKPDS